MKLNLSLTPNRTQRYATNDSKTGTKVFPRPLQGRASRAVFGRPVLRGDRNFLRQLRAAEMAAWDVGKKFVATLAFVVLSACGVTAAEKIAYWQVDADGKWADSSRWSGPSYPDNSGTNLFSAIVDMPNRTVSLDRNITIESFTFSRGAVDGTNAPVLTLNQQFQWGGNKFTGEGYLTANGMTITGATKTVHGWTLENRGIANWLGGDIHLGDGSRLYNQPAGGFNANFDGQLVNDIGGAAWLDNAGMFRKSAGTGQTKIYIPSRNTGTIEADAGQLAFYGNSTNIGGNVQVLAGASVQYNGIRHTFDAASTLGGTGALDFYNGTIDINGTVDLKGPVSIGLATVNLTPTSNIKQFGGSLIMAQSGLLNLNSGETNCWNSLTFSNGQLSGSDFSRVGAGGLQWLGGSFNGPGQLDLDGNTVISGGSKSLRGGWVLQNHATVQWLKGDVSTGESARFVNLPGASLQTPFDGAWSLGNSGTSRFENFGVLQKTGGTNYTTLGVTVYNEGLIEADVAAIRFSSNFTNQGALNMSAGAALIFGSPSIYLGALGSLDGDGEAILEAGTLTDYGSFRTGAGVTLKSGTLRFNSTTSRPNFGAQIKFINYATLDLKSGYSLGVPQLLHTNGMISGSDTLVVSNQWTCVNGDLDGSGRLELRGASWINGGPQWTGWQVANYGDFSWAGGDINAGLGLMLHNYAGGTINVTCDRTFSASYGGSAAVLNEGTFRKDSSSGTTTFIPSFVNNDGDVFVNSGRLQFTGGFAQTNGRLQLNSTVVVSPKPFLIHSGIVAGSGDILGSLVNEGALTPGAGQLTGRLNISGACTQTVTSVLKIKIGGTNQFDVLSVTNLASLNGQLDCLVLPGYAPKAGDTFPILKCGSRIGQFSQLTGASLPGELQLIPVYQTNGVALTVVSTAGPPPSLTIQPVAGTLKVSWPADATGWTLQSCTNLSAPDWLTLSVTGTNSTIVTANLPRQFFRLQKVAP